MLSLTLDFELSPVMSLGSRNRIFLFNVPVDFENSSSLFPNYVFQFDVGIVALVIAVSTVKAKPVASTIFVFTGF